MAKNRIVGIIFSNMHDHALHQLTERRTTSSIPFGGRYRFIDFILSSMVNSGIYSIGVIAKNNYESLMDHLGCGREWDLSRKNGGLYILPPYGNTATGIYSGRIEALHGMLEYINRSTEQYVVLSDSNLICNMDFGEIIKFHEQKEAQITIAYQKKEIDAKTGATVFSLNGDGRISDIMVNPAVGSEQNVSTNVMVMEKDLLIRVVRESYNRGLYSFTKDVLQKQIDNLSIYGYEYKKYLSKIDTLSNYFRANMDLLDAGVREELFMSQKSIYTKVTDHSPTRYGLNSKISNSLIADGCLIEGEVVNSIVSRGVYVGKGAVIRNSIVMLGDRISDNAELGYCILDKNVIVNERRRLMGAEDYPNYIAKGSVV